MKKLFALFLALLLLFSVTACSKNPEMPTGTGDRKDPVQNDTTTSLKTPDGTTVPDDNWGVMDYFSSSRGGKSVTFVINFPEIKGIIEGMGLIAGQGDGTKVVVSSYSPSGSPEVGSIADVFPAYFEQTLQIFKVNYGSRYSDGQMTVESKEAVTLNGYAMYKFTGTHTFQYAGKERSHPYIAYALQLKANGAVAYWLVQDESEDQSLGSLIADHAYRMALSFKEVD